MMHRPFLLFMACLLPATTLSYCHEEERRLHPVLCRWLEEKDTNRIAQEMNEWARQHHLLVDFRTEGTTALDKEMTITKVSAKSRQLDASQLPVVLAHGMGDSCFNKGMQHLTQHVSQLLGGVYTVCIPTGKNQQEDTKNGYFLNMDASVDVFAEAIQQNDQLQNGFHAIGFSQGNNVIRGYMTRYNTPAVHTFLSINGVNAGEGAVPYCRPSFSSLFQTGFSMCDLLMEQASHRAYTQWSQQHSFQANYWRDPRLFAMPLYYEYSQLARWNQEGPHYQSNTTWIENYLKTQQFVWIMADEDAMVWPKEGEQWGAPDPDDPFERVLPMEETEWYTRDSFGLATAQSQGKNYFETFPGDHLRFSMEDFERWIHTYLVH
ncbi:palmitoyl-protein thioesterase [Fistulifera solaris]|uniref:Palmitoyl-protein thioesterase 1 n=1 Tax=Fistulifera solaris TaxID=1519565 RepID=A0A1Z5KC36_FISSO|nr:palmitoyl-protein thioesterase [Fistulifera solaris]|eukprot:GAX23833.1 palmitoyl-protein thioesterase [Fistulifera solaris]